MSRLLRGMQNEQKELTKSIYEICWYMRGGITREEAWSLSTNEREIIYDIIKQNLENTKKTGMPLL